MIKNNEIVANNQIKKLVYRKVGSNDCAHNGRLYTYHSKFFISYQKIDKAYKKKDDLVNLYILINCMGRLLDEKNYKKFVKQVNSEINKLSRRISSINIKKILNIMGFQYE